MLKKENKYDAREELGYDKVGPGWKQMKRQLISILRGGRKIRNS